jgi:hypothetical protein
MIRKRTSSADIRGCNVAELQKEKNFATSWEQLAEMISARSEISITARAIQNWRNDPRYEAHWPRPKSGRHDVRKWIEFMVRFDLKRAIDVTDPEEVPEEQRNIRDWKEHREKLMCEKLEHLRILGDSCDQQQAVRSPFDTFLSLAASYTLIYGV